MVKRCLFLLVMLGTTAIFPAIAHAHPIHMSFTEIRMTPRGDSVELVVKVFANDFSAAAARHTGAKLRADSLIDARRGFAYLASRIRIAKKGSSPMAMIPCGVARVNDMLRFCFRAPLTGARKDVQFSNSVMTELFHDQVNVVQSIVGQRRASRMFVRGDGWKSVL